MRVVVLSCIEWDDRNAFGNTVSNFFDNWPQTKFASIYGRSTMPNNKVCDVYYRVTPNDIVKHLLCPKRIGSHFIIDNKSANETKHNKEKKTIAKLQRSHFYSIALLVVDLLYNSCLWINKKYKQFINEFNPDVVFVFGKGDSFLLRNAQYIKKNTRAKLVTFIADDVRGWNEQKGMLRSVRLRNLDSLIRLSDKVFGASEMLCSEYSEIYHIPITPLYKGCEFMPIISKDYEALDIVYAGNLYYGRVEVLGKLAEAINNVNRDSTVKYHLSIYSNSFISDEEQQCLEIPGASELHPPLPYQEVMKVMNNASIVLHVESFQASQIERVRLSFSTKIIDCLQSGSVLMVIGPENIASVVYAEKIPGVIVVKKMSEIEATLVSLTASPKRLEDRAIKMREYSVNHHSMTSNRALIQSLFNELIAN